MSPFVTGKVKICTRKNGAHKKEKEKKMMMMPGKFVLIITNRMWVKSYQILCKIY